MKKLIYSKKYHDLEELDIPADELLSALSEAENKIYKDLVYIPIPGREDIKDIFIQRAKDFSEKYEYDIDIYSAKGGVELTLSFDHQYTFSDFNRLIGMADDIFISSGIKGREFTVGLTLYTHEIYRGGKRFLPAPEEEYI